MKKTSADLTPEALARLKELGGTVPKLRTKHRGGPTKFGGKKRKNSNSGGTGRVSRATKRPRVVSQRTSPEQYMKWKQATSPSPKS